jgi:hypothetical protein
LTITQWDQTKTDHNSQQPKSRELNQETGRITAWSHLGEGRGGTGSVVEVLGEGLGSGEHERAVPGLLEVLLAVVLRGVEVDAGAPLQGCEERRRHASGHPDRVALQLLVREDAAVGVDAAHCCHRWPRAGRATTAGTRRRGRCGGRVVVIFYGNSGI